LAVQRRARLGIHRRRMLGADQLRKRGSAARIWREHSMAAMKPRTGDGPLEATKEGRGIVMRVPLEGGGRLVVELTPDEAAALGDELKGVTS
jgi:Protein of unknown function (DUF3117)